MIIGDGWYIVTMTKCGTESLKKCKIGRQQFGKHSYHLLDESFGERIVIQRDPWRRWASLYNFCSKNVDKPYGWNGHLTVNEWTKQYIQPDEPKNAYERNLQEMYCTRFCDIPWPRDNVVHFKCIESVLGYVGYTGKIPHVNKSNGRPTRKLLEAISDDTCNRLAAYLRRDVDLFKGGPIW